MKNSLVRERDPAKKLVKRRHKKVEWDNTVTSGSQSVTKKGRRRLQHEESDTRKKNFPLSFTLSLVAITIIGVVCSIIYQGYLETRIYTPLDGGKVVTSSGQEISNRFWGAYRSGVYFGLKHRSPKPISAGLMWLVPSQLRPGDPKLRHLCQQHDNLKKYGWIQHDGVNFGIQEIHDTTMKLTTSFVKRDGGRNGGDWTARITAEPTGKNGSAVGDEILLFFYITKEPGQEGVLRPEFSNNLLSQLHGNTLELGNFIVRFLNGGDVIHGSKLITSISSMNEISDATLQNIESIRVKEKIVYRFRATENSYEDPNLFIHQVHVKAPFTLEIVFESASYNRASMLAGEVYSATLDDYRKKFDIKFENTFHLETKKFNSTSIQFSKAALSNLIGGIGYFSGTSKVQSIYNSNPVPYWPANLYTAVPSRSFFPRGFLWDEGFHLLLINTWNPEISLDIISHWLDLMNVEGWIPREQILGDEALSRVPEEYVVQRNDVANPPTLVIALADLLRRHGEWLSANHKDTLARMWPRLTAWYNWLNRTQSGEISSSYRWRGRNATTEKELNPKTLASGLDDYPRASHPTDSERHLDLRCWMAVASKLMRDLANMLSYDGQKYDETFLHLTDPQILDPLHWSEELKSYADYGFHSPNVRLVAVRPTEQNTRKGQPPPPPFYIRQVDKNYPPAYRFVDMFGYVSLFPMLLGILKSDSKKLQSIIERLDDPTLLWTPYGLRSLATTAPLYKTRNTEHDPPYWRNPIWININFLALKSLKEYSEELGPIGVVAKEKYVKLREVVMENIIREYWRTGYIWEQYDDSTGEGKGCRPFTGWSSLVVLIMAEDY